MKDWIRQALVNTATVFVGVALALIVSQVLTRPMSGPRAGLYAVFLTNGQVYFGRITEDRQDALVLESVFYAKQSRDAVTSPNQADDYQLVKLGSELHAPEDRTELIKTNVLRIERLKEDGKVAQAIATYKK